MMKSIFIFPYIKMNKNMFCWIVDRCELFEIFVNVALIAFKCSDMFRSTLSSNARIYIYIHMCVSVSVYNWKDIIQKHIWSCIFLFERYYANTKYVIFYVIVKAMRKKLKKKCRLLPFDVLKCHYSVIWYVLH